MKKKKKHKIDIFKKNIVKHKNDLPFNLGQKVHIETNSWFDISKQLSSENKNLF